MGIIAWSIPAFVVAIALEWAWARRRGVEVYRFNDAVTDLNCGVGSQALGLVFFVATVGVYDYVFETYALVEWPPNDWRMWLIAIVGLDFLYYWWHRISHVSNFFWAIHAVHHQSEDYNFAVALRQASFGGFTTTLFYLPLALCGVPTEAYLVSNAISLLYQFWIHTELIDRLPAWYEWTFNTPSHHRAHHAINPQYLDKNYAAILMLWDRVFGSFEPERERPVYGITRPIDSYNAVWANLHHFFEIGRQAWAALRAGDLGGALWVWWAHPSWHPEAAKALVEPAPPNGMDGRPKYEVPRGRHLGIYVALVMLANVPLTMGMLLYADRLAAREFGLCVLSLVLAGMTLGGLIERRSWALPFEGLRLLVFAWVARHMWLVATGVASQV